MKVKLCDMHARRERILHYLHKNTSTTNQLSEKLGMYARTLRNDMTFFRLAGFIQDGPQMIVDGRKYRSYRCTTLPSYDQLVAASTNVYQESIEDVPEFIPDLPELILEMMGYNTRGTPRGGRFIDNADFHPLPTRTTKHKVHIGNAWGQIMEMAL